MKHLQIILRILNPLFYFFLVLSIAGITFGLLGRDWFFVQLGLGVCLLIILVGTILDKLLLPPHYRAAFKRYQKGDMDSALELINKSIEARPQSCEAYALRAYFHICKKQLDQAKKDAQQAIQLKPDWYPGYRALGQWFYYQGYYAEAVDPFAEALRLDPKNGLHYCSLGVVYYRLQEYEKAVEYLQKAVLMKSPEKRNKFRTPTQIKHTLIFL